MAKLKSYGINGTELKLFENYLNDKKQQVKFKNETFEDTNVPIGLPQETALSVILFSLYINNMMNVSRNCTTLLYADDTVLMSKDKTMNGAANCKLCHKIIYFNEDPTRLYDWLKETKLIMNVSKMKCMLLTKRTENNKIITKNVQINKERDIIA